MSNTDFRSAVEIIYGAFPVCFLSEDEAKAVYKVLKDKGVKRIDTARIYEGSEKSLGESGWSKDFIVDTKAPGFGIGKQDAKGLNAAIEESLSLLQIPSVDTYYLHTPDPTTPIEDVLFNINELYKQGKFRRFGISNFPPNEVKQVYEIAKKNNYVLPSVYQGNYNAFARLNEEDLFPLLKELGIAFYAYSPVAGGFLTKTSEEMLQNKSPRFEEGTPAGSVYRSLYLSEPFLKALDQFGAIAKENGIEQFELAYRWVAHNSGLDASKGDGLIIGGRTAEQVEKALVAIENGPLPDAVITKLNNIWADIRDGAARDNWQAVQALMAQQAQ